ncbi:MAG: T9SS type A sorting domain-containing protein [Bacteroidota bacterium]|nr:T9SS type A sorting domain-containing protein [Bacteroidota bacterium]
MRTPRASFLVIFVCSLLFLTGIATGQSVTIGTIPASHFCVGDSITVSFTATGTLNHGNAFSLQLSDPDGSFTNFQKIGSLADTMPGTFSITGTIPIGLTSSTHYRFRILAAIPYMTSADNGNDISIGTPPTCFYFTNDQPGYIGTRITFTAVQCELENNGDYIDTATWDFGSDASPATATTPATGASIVSFSQDVMYSDPGEKTVTITVVKPGGCPGRTMTHNIHIYDCTFPTIPHDAIVVNSDMGVSDRSKTFWINPGFSLVLSPDASNDTIFAEPGSSISGAYNCVVYAKPGSILTSTKYSGSNAIIYGNGASITPVSSDFTLDCSTFDFDYTNAPPNPAHPHSGVASTSPASLTISPNPARGIISIQGAPSSDLNVSVLNLIGETMMQRKNPQTSDFTLDLSKLPAGIYYVRFSSANSVVTKKVVKE